MQVTDDDRAAADAFLLRGSPQHEFMANLFASHRTQATAELVGVLREVVEALEAENPLAWAGTLGSARAIIAKHS